MNKELEIKKLLSALAAAKNLQTRLTESKINELSKTLSALIYTSKQTVKEKIGVGDIIIKEAIDFSDTNYWIDRIVDIINNN